MIKEITFCGIIKFKKIQKNTSTAVISILDESEQGSRPKLNGFFKILKLTFEDRSEQGTDFWPDEPTIAEHKQYTNSLVEKVPTLDDAKKTVEFLDHLHADAKPIVLVVHCFAGVSRSAAIASWAASRYWAPLATSNSTERANPRLIRLLNKASNRI